MRASSPRKNSQQDERRVRAYGTKSSEDALEPMTVKRREVGPYDVEINLKYCGVCHSDIHHARNDWSDSEYPMIPGHEMMGIVSQVGEKVVGFKNGDRVAVGNLVNSCRHCKCCAEGRENYCLNGGPSWVYNGRERKPGELKPEGERTFGGYSQMIVVNKDFVLSVPDNIPLDKGTPLLCAGITVYSPLIQKRVGKNHVVGVAGIGGLGHLAVKMAKAMGATVVAITTTEEKIDRIPDLGADKICYFPDPKSRKEHEGTMDLIIDTIPYPHSFDPYLDLLGVDGTLWMLGVLQEFRKDLNGKKLTDKNRCICGSNVGGIQMTKDMLTFCSKHNITADIEVIDIQDINTAFEDVINKLVYYRFVIDLSSLK